MMNVVPAPTKRSDLRRLIGKKYYQLKRNVVWFLNRSDFATTRSESLLLYSVIDHRSMLLRPLKNVDMYLQHNKIQNLRLAINKINGVIIEPGKTFSLWYLVGKPSRSKGYLPGLILNQGQIQQGVGGGLCQLGNLLFWMALHTPLTITERYRHGYDVFPDVNRTIPFGCGATLSYNYIDLQIKNESSHTFQINLWLSDEYLHGEIRSNEPINVRYDVYESHHQIVHQYWGGYTRHNQINRRTYDKKTGKELDDRLILENHAIMMYAPLLPGANV